MKQSAAGLGQFAGQRHDPQRQSQRPHLFGKGAFRGRQHHRGEPGGIVGAEESQHIQLSAIEMAGR